MEPFIIFLKGLLIGLAVAVPLGPVGVLCIRRTLHRGLRAGIVSGLGAATADALYGGVAVFGFAAISVFLLKLHLWLEFMGGLFLFFIGIAVISTPRRFSAKRIEHSQRSDYASAFILALTNPTLILSFGAIFALFRIIELRHLFFASMLMLGIFFGSMVWWIILCLTLCRLHGKLGDSWIAKINFFAGALLIIFALISLGNVLEILIRCSYFSSCAHWKTASHLASSIHP